MGRLRSIPAPWLGVLLIGVTLWVFADVGWKVTPVNDGWITLARNASEFHLRSDPARSLGDFPTRIGVLLTPESTVGLQLVLWGLTTSRGLLVLVLVRRHGAPALVGLVAAVFAVAYPADTGLSWLGALAFHAAVVAALAATLVGHLSKRATTLAVGAVMACYALWSHPIAVPIMVVGIGSLWARSGRRLTAATVAYGSVVAVYLIFIALVFDAPGTRSASVDFAAALVPGNAAISFRRLFLGGWIDAWQAVLPGTVVAASVLVIVGRLAWFESGDRLSSPLGLASAGVTLFVLSLAPFLATPIGSDPKRTLVVPGIGIGLVVSSVVWVLTARGRVFAMVLSLLVVVTAISYLREEKTTWAEKSYLQQQLLAQVASVVPNPRQGATFVIAFEDPLVRRSVQGLTNRDIAFASALQYGYDDPTLTVKVVNASDPMMLTPNNPYRLTVDREGRVFPQPGSEDIAGFGVGLQPRGRWCSLLASPVEACG